MKYQYGLQMFSVRDSAEKDIAKTLKDVGEIGYRQIEFAGFFGKTPDEICRFMEEAGVVISGVHSGWQALMPDVIDETIAFHKAIGNPNYIIPSAHLETLAKMDEFVGVVNPAQEKLAKNGIELSFHNHGIEFATQYWGTNMMAELEKRTDLKFEIDTYWAFNAGVDPVVLCDQLKHRIDTIHLKDGFAGGRGVALGEGHAPVKKVLDFAREKRWNIIVESEGLMPNGLAEVTRCMNYLKENG